MSTEPTLLIADTGALKCKSSSGACIEDIVAQNALPSAFKDDSFKQFRIAGAKKITLDPATGNYATGPKDEHLLFSYNELASLGDIPNAKYLQFIPEGTPFSVLDFDTDKSLGDEERHKQVNYITDTLLKQFDGRIEYSASHLGIHAYIQDKKLNAMNLRKKLKISKDIPGVGKIDLEVFAAKEPITLTFNYVEESAFDFDTIPERMMNSVVETSEHAPTPSTEEEVYAERIQFEIDNSKLSQEVLNHFTNLDKKDQLHTGYPEKKDCSNVDLYMATLTHKAGFTPNQSYTFMVGWMEQHRPKSSNPISTMEIKNKARRSVARAFKTDIKNTPEPTDTDAVKKKEKALTLPEVNIKIDEMFEKNGKVEADDFMSFISGQKQFYITPKTFIPIEGTDLFFNGATHMIIAPSKEGKTTLIIDEVAKTKKRVIMLDGDGNGADAVDEAGKNTIWLQPISPDNFLDTILYSIDSASIDYSDYIFIIDSLKNFRDKISIDGNDASDIVDRIKKLTSTGGAVIILHHVTGTADGKVKMKGNEEAILSSCDITYTYNRERGLYCYKSRIKGVVNGQSMSSTKEEPDTNLMMQIEKM